MNLLVFAGLRGREHTLTYKIAPVLEMDQVDRVFIIRPGDYRNKKVTCIYPRQAWLRKSLFFEFFRLWQALRIIIMHRPKVIIGIGMIPHGMSAVLLAKLTFRKSILLLMGKNDLYLTYPDKRRMQKLLTWLATKASAVGTKGTNSRAYIIKHGKPEQQVFIPHHLFDFENFSYQQHEKIYDLVYVGYMSFYKRIDLLIEACEQLVSKYQQKSLRVALVGNGHLIPQLKEKVYALGLKDNITFLPPGDRAYIQQVFNQSKIFAMTSQGEGLPNVLIEAMSCRIPAVIFDDADISDLVIDGVNGYLVPLHDVDAFAQRVNVLLSDREKLEQFSLNAEKIKADKAKDFSLPYLLSVWSQAFESIGLSK
ncbi:glycosyltransferase [Carboxylicivirga taeanensis]|uniref:glycosyltransferase n=1 Tax=Carboxylicivirga taeanensis TaxID=1416875 RepID=UPI003F6DF631